MARASRARKSRLAVSTQAGKAHAQVMARSKPGAGTRFASMKKQLRRKGARSPAALAAWIGRRKYGAKKMTQMAVKGKMRGK